MESKLETVSSKFEVAEGKRHEAEARVKDLENQLVIQAKDYENRVLKLEEELSQAQSVDTSIVSDLQAQLE
jgi:predicted  nucleic acid-binding Zn-ribbon protein